MTPHNNGQRSSVTPIRKRTPVVAAIEETRAVDGARAATFNVLKRRVKLESKFGVYRLELAEQRTLVVPWLRWPIHSYWRIRVLHGLELAPCETVARVFLSTGHCPAEWWLG